MTTKLFLFVQFSLFSLLTSIALPVFAEEINRSNEFNTPQGTTQNNDYTNKHGTSGVNAGATAKSVASAKIAPVPIPIPTPNLAPAPVPVPVPISAAPINTTPTQDSVNTNECNEKNGESKKNESNKINVTNKINKTNKTSKINRKNKKVTVVIKKTTTDNFGVKEIPFVDNEQIKVVLSNRDINRVFVTGDKIKTIHGPAGLYTAKNDPSDPFGSAYITIYSDTSFTIFLSTIKGHNFSLLITPKTTPGRTVILQPITPILLANNQVETDNYQKTLIELITNMINVEPTEDYEYFSVNDAKKRGWIKNAKKIKKVNFYNIVDVTPLAFFRGEKLSGIISSVRNKTKNPLTLQPSYFYQSGIKAVALSKQTIPSLGESWLYQIVGQD